MSFKRNDQDNNKRRPGCLIALGIFFLLVFAGGVFAARLINNFNNTMSEIQVSRSPDQLKLREMEVPVEELLDKKQSFSILLLGIDNENQDGVSGRSDIMVVATINPSTSKATLTSIPRDTRTEIVGRNMEDKINHAYAFGGISMAANSVQRLLDIPIDYTISLNMEGFIDLVDIIGGIPIVASESFSQHDYQFVAGESYQMDGKMTLAYIRNRKDAGGDYGRQTRARQVIEAAIRKAISFESIFDVYEIMNVLEGNLLTDIRIENVLEFVQDYQETITSIETFQLQGKSQIIDGIYYEIIDEASLKKLISILQKELNYD